jgi:two-component system, NtrC family, nitrogen regulation response regulator NtrX
MNKNILLVDDDGMITKTIGNLLKREGFNPELAEGGLEAIEKIKDIEFGLIITDIRMPYMDGLEVINKIKGYLKESKKSDVPVIFITGYADSDAHIKAERLGKVIFKPFDMKDFLEQITNYLNK